MNNAGNTIAGEDQSFTIAPVGGLLDIIAFSSREGAIKEVRIFSATVAAEDESWGRIPNHKESPR